MNGSRKLPDWDHYRVLFSVGSLSGLSDGELLVRFLRREDSSAELAFAALVKRHSGVVMRICRAIVRNEHDAEDAFQATFLVLASKADRLRVTGSLAPWLSGVARRVARGARAVAVARAARELRAAELAQTTTSPASDDRAEIASAVHEEIECLPERDRLVLFYCDLENQTHQEAAQKLGWPLGTVKSRQARARARLRVRLRRRGFSDSLPAGCALPSAKALVPETLIQTTSRAAARIAASGTAAQTVSASVKALVTQSLRSMIMKRYSVGLGALLTATIGVVAVATVLAQTAPDSGNRPVESTAPKAAPLVADGGPMLECELKIMKDGTVVTPAVKVILISGRPTVLATADGLVEIRFHPQSELLEARHEYIKSARMPASDAAKTAVPKGVDASAVAKMPAGEAAKTAMPNALDAAALERYLGLQRELLESAQARMEKLKKLVEGNHGVSHSVATALMEARSAAEDARSKAAERQPGAGTSDDHEKRLAEIERKLERILRALEAGSGKSRNVK